MPGANGENGFTATQTYSYDSLNRLKAATEKIGGNVNWQQTFNYDIYGNRNFDEANTTTLPTDCVENTVPVICENDRKALNPTINQTNNKFADQQGYEYDENGNVTKDSDGKQFVYDALNKQVEVKDINNQVLGNYYYDQANELKKLIVIIV